MTVVTADNIRSWSKLDFDALGYAEGPDPDTLQTELDRAVAYVESVTGRLEADLTDGSIMDVQYGQAVQLRLEQQITQRQAGFVSDQNEDAIDISVTGYSQRRVAMKERNPAGMINPWPELNDLLIALLTDEKIAYWTALGKYLVVSNGVVEEIQDIAWVNDSPPDVGWVQ